MEMITAVGLGLLGLLGSGLFYQSFASWIDRWRHPPVGTLHDIGESSLHMLSMGHGSPPVLLESALAGSCLSWTRIQPQIAELTRVVSYDRAGFGWSDPAPSPRTLSTMAEELGKLLEAANLAEPVVLVGHSWGGLIARRFIALHPDRVAALVLIDPAHPEEWSEPPPVQARRIERGVRLARRMAWLCTFGVPRLLLQLLRLARLRSTRIGAAMLSTLSTGTRREQSRVEQLLARTPVEIHPHLRAWWSTPKCYRAVASLIDNVSSSARSFEDEGSYGDRPVVVLSESNPSSARIELQEALAARSTRGRHRTVPASGHWIPLDAPEMVVETVRDVIEMLRESATTTAAPRERYNPGPMAPTQSELIEKGRARLERTRSHMKILEELRARFEKEKPFQELTIGICLHVEPKTGILVSTLEAGGAKVRLTGSPGTTQDDVVAALQSGSVRVFGAGSDGKSEHLVNIRKVLDGGPQLLLDNGADLVAALLAPDAPHDLSRLRGGTEETTTGANRLRSELAGKVPFPVIVINDSPLKLIVENEHGVGQTVVEGFMRATNLMVPGKRFVVIGYGPCGRGIARYSKNFGARVAVVDTDSIRALEAAMDGMRVASLEQLLDWGQVFITVTGRPDVIRKEHIDKMPDGAILANAGHFQWEIALDALRDGSVDRHRFSSAIEQFTQPDGRRITLLAGGEMLNLAGGQGNPVETMDLGLALQALSLVRVVERRGLVAGPQPVPDDINEEIASRMVRILMHQNLG